MNRSMKEGTYLLQHTKKIYKKELSKMKDIFLVSAECEEFRVYCISDRASMLLSWIENFRGEFIMDGWHADFQWT